MPYERYVTITRADDSVPFAYEAGNLLYVLIDLVGLGIATTVTITNANLQLNYTHVCEDYNEMVIYKEYITNSAALAYVNQYAIDNSQPVTITYDSPATEALWDSIPVPPPEGTPD